MISAKPFCFTAADAAAFLAQAGHSSSPLIALDEKGSCWCFLPLEDEILLAGPVQTGQNPLFPYDGVPERSWHSFRNICRCLTSLLLGPEAALSEKQTSRAETQAAQKMLRHESDGVEFKSFDELYICVITGDLTRLDTLISSGSYLMYLDQVMTNMDDARTVFQFNLAKTYHCAQQTQATLEDLTPLVDYYLKESAGYRSLAAYKSGNLRMLYDFTRYVHQFQDARFSPLINQAVMYIREHLYSQISVEDIARHCMVSLSTLQHKFKGETGMSLKEKIRAAKIERSCFFLRNTDLSSVDIAYRMGYGSQSYFIKQFQREIGMSPAEYKEGCATGRI